MSLPLAPALDHVSLVAFAIAATSLLGSPGPGIAALVSVGRAEGLTRGLRFYAGLQLGLAVAAAAAAAGVGSVLDAFPAAMTVLTLAATAYLAHLAYRVATAPVGGERKAGHATSSVAGGMILGVANPKTLLAFASLFGMRAITDAGAAVDVAAKWVLCVAIMIVVDFLWLLGGVALHRRAISAGTERLLNRGFGAAILLAAAASLL